MWWHIFNSHRFVVFLVNIYFITKISGGLQECFSTSTYIVKKQSISKIPANFFSLDNAQLQSSFSGVLVAEEVSDTCSPAPLIIRLRSAGANTRHGTIQNKVGNTKSFLFIDKTPSSACKTYFTLKGWQVLSIWEFHCCGSWFVSFIYWTCQGQRWVKLSLVRIAECQAESGPGTALSQAELF